MAGEFKRIEDEFGKYGSTALFSNLLLILLIIGLLVIANWIAESESSRHYNYLVILLGSVCGWAIGMFISPYSEKEARKFISIGQAISAFATGYVVSKFDRFLEATLFIDNKVPQFDAWIRLALFLSAMALFALLIFSNRAYFRTEE